VSVSALIMSKMPIGVGRDRPEAVRSMADLQITPKSGAHVKRRALVVIDVQNEYITGNFLIEYPPVETSIPNIARAIDSARIAGIPVVAVQHILPSNAPVFAEGSVGAQLHPVVADRPYDLLVTKTLPSVFSASEFAPWLRENQIDTLTIIGYMTHNCNDATAREAMHRGFDVELLADAAGSLPYKNNGGTASAEEIYRVTSTVMESAYGAVTTTDQWITRLSERTETPRDNIFFSNQRALGKM
jgi:nicotinamidase-related amidase